MLLHTVINPKSQNPSKTRFSRQKRVFIPDSKDAKVSCLVDYFNYEVRNLTQGIMTQELVVKRPSVFDPIEIIIKGDSSGPSSYHYIVEAVNQGKKIYSNEFECIKPWDFFNIRRDFEGENDLHQQLDMTVHPFELRMKNDSWYFNDCLGRGWAKVLIHTLRSFWVVNQADLLDANLVQAWENLVGEDGAGLSIKARLGFLLKGYLDHLRTLHTLCTKIADDKLDEQMYLDFEYVMIYFEELIEVYKKVFHPLEFDAKERASTHPNQGHAQKMLRLYNIFMALPAIKGVASTRNAHDLLGALPDPRQVKEIILNISPIIDLICPTDADIQRLRTFNQEMGKRICKYNRDVIQHLTPSAQKYGLAWRCNLFFFNLLKRSLFDRMVSNHLPRFKSLFLAGSKTAAQSEDDCYFRIQRFGYVITLNEMELLFRKIKDGPDPEVSLQLPARLVASQYKLLGNKVFLNLKNRGVRNWGYALHQVDLELLRTGEPLKLDQVKGYDVPVTYSYSRRLLNLVYIKGLVCHVGVIHLDYGEQYNKIVDPEQPPQKKQFSEKARDLFKLLPAEGDEDPELKNIEWKHLTMSSGIHKGTCIYQISHYESETIVSQRLYAYKYQEDVGLKPLVSRYRKFPREFFDGRRVEPRHHSVFALRKTLFCLLCSDRMNYHLSAFSGGQFITVMSWRRPKRVLLGWGLTGAGNQVYSAWDEQNEKMCMYARTSKAAALHLGESRHGLVLMQVRLKY